MESNNSPEKNIMRNTAWLIFSGMLGIANSVLLWIFMARWRDPVEVGHFTAVMSMYTIFMTLCTLGLSPYLANEISRREEKGPFVASAVMLIVIWALVCTGIMGVTGYLIDRTPVIQAATLLLSLAMLPTGLISVSEALFIAQGRAKVVSLASTTENLLRSIIPLYLLFRGASLVSIFSAFVVMRFAACAVYGIVGRRWLPALRLASWGRMCEIRRVAPVFVGVTVLAAIHWQLGAVLIHQLAGEEETAKYGVASRFLVPVTLLLTSYASVLQPAAARIVALSRDSLGAFLSRSLRIVVALGLPLTIGGVLLGRELLVLLFGERYAEASPALACLALTIVPFGLVMVVARGLVATQRQNKDLLANLVAVMANVSANLFLIPRYGAVGAAMAQCFSVALMAWIAIRIGLLPVANLNIRQAFWICRWPLIALTLIVWQVRAFGFWWALLAGGAAYLIGLAVIWNRIRPERKVRIPAVSAPASRRPRILMLGAHPTRTIGGISTLINDILHSPLTNQFEIRHLVSQMDEYGKFGKLLLALTAYLRLIGRLIYWRPALVYVHLGGNASLYRKGVFIVTARALGYPVITHFHAGNFESYFERQGSLGRRWILFGIGCTDRFLAVSQDMARLIRHYWPAAEIGIIPNGIDTGLFACERALAGDLQGKIGDQRPLRILFVGKMGFLKGEADLIAALQHVIKDHPYLRVDLLGQLSGEIGDLCQRSGVRPLIDQLGPVPLEERVGYYRRADIFVLPTYAEGMSISVLEAMAAGLPIITTRVGGNYELVEDGGEGYLIDPGDIDALRDRLVGLITDPQLRRLMGEAASRKAARFDLQQLYHRLGIEINGDLRLGGPSPISIGEALR